MSGPHKNNIFLNASGFIVQQQFADFVVLESCSKKYFHVFILDTKSYKTLMEIAARIESVRKFFPSDIFRNLKARVIPNDTQIVHGLNGVLYLLMPYHFGTLFNEMIKWDYQCGTNLIEKRARPILYQIVELMEFCYRAGLFFLDFKLDKYVFADSEKKQIRPLSPLILCFADNNSSIRYVFMPFMAPELLSGNSGNTVVAAEMWALGVLAFFLLNRQYPFIGSTPGEMASNIRSRRISLMKQFTIEARVMIWALLCQNVMDRPSPERLKQCHWFTMCPEDLKM